MIEPTTRHPSCWPGRRSATASTHQVKTAVQTDPQRRRSVASPRFVQMCGHYLEIEPSACTPKDRDGIHRSAGLAPGRRHPNDGFSGWASRHTRQFNILALAASACSRRHPHLVLKESQVLDRQVFEDHIRPWSASGPCRRLPRGPGVARRPPTSLRQQQVASGSSAADRPSGRRAPSRSHSSDSAQGRRVDPRARRFGRDQTGL